MSSFLLILRGFSSLLVVLLTEVRKRKNAEAKTVRTRETRGGALFRVRKIDRSADKAIFLPNWRFSTAAVQ